MIPDPARLAGCNPAGFRKWRPGYVGSEIPHGEIFASACEGSGAGLALAFALDRMRSADPDTSDQRAWLWVQDREALRRTGRPYHPGLPPALRHRLIHVAAGSAEDALFALEEGLRCCDLAFVIGEVTGNPAALSFTSSRRLSLAVQRYGVPFWLIRLDARRDLSSARMRWQVRAASSPPPRWNAQAPGSSAWRADLFRARGYPPGQWILHDDAGRLVVRSPLLSARSEESPSAFFRKKAGLPKRSFEGRVGRGLGSS